MRVDGDVRRADKRNHRKRLDQPDQREGGARTDGEDRRRAKERRDDADHGDRRLARADLVAAMLAVPNRSEVGVVREPVADLAQRGDDDEGD